jgi:hypothetical protein
LGYARGLISSRKIEQACRENVVFIALACGQQPDHSTIAAFVSSMKDEILPLFRDVLLVCQEMDLLGGTFFALDGVKLPSNASKDWSGTYSELQRKKVRIEAKVKQLLEEHVQEDQGGAHRHSETNIRKCQELRLDAYIPDLYFRRRDPRYATQQRYWPRRKTFTLEDFCYDEVPDQYVCPNGKRLKRKVRSILRDGLVQRGYIADEQDCQLCPLRPRCLTGRGGKRRYLWVTIGAELTNLSKSMAAKIDTEQGRKIYPQRFAVVEPVFANIRTQKRLDRFTLRGKVKVNIQWLLYSIIHNIEKIRNYGFA